MLRRLEVSGQPVDWYEPAPLPDCYARLPTTPGHCLAEARNLRVVDPELRIALGAAWLEDGSQIQHVFNVAAADTLDEGADAVRAALAD
ncbi:MAG: hypothetical protein ACXWEF_05245 [Solirubrobacterales bacterium]